MTTKTRVLAALANATNPTEYNSAKKLAEGCTAAEQMGLIDSFIETRRRLVR